MTMDLFIQATTKLRPRRSRLPAVLCLAVFVALAGARALPAAAGPVRLPQDAALETALAALQREAGGAVLAEAPQVDRRLPEPLEADPPVALEAISRWYHLYVISRPGSIALQRRFGDGWDDPRVSREEATAALSDLERLARPFWPGLTDITVITDQRDFYRSLSRGQSARMQEGGLPFRELRPEQQRLWLKINSRQAFGTPIETLIAGAAGLRAWDRTGGYGWLTRPTQMPGGAIEPFTALWYRFPDPENPGETTGYHLPDRLNPQEAVPGLPAAGEAQPARAGLPQAFEARLQARPGVTTLAELVREIARATEREIRLPAYARQWPLLAFVSGATAQEALGALEDLYGWRLRHQEGRIYALGRPTLPAAENVLDLYRKMRAALPPPTRRLLDQESILGMSLRVDRQVNTVVPAAQKKFGRGWSPVKPSELGPESEQLLFDLVFELVLRRIGNELLPSGGNPHWWVVAPERGLFTLEGDLRGNPLVQFHVTRPDGKSDAWGWFVGTNSLGE
jgi:hypothetical protein